MLCSAWGKREVAQKKLKHLNLSLQHKISPPSTSSSSSLDLQGVFSATLGQGISPRKVSNLVFNTQNPHWRRCSSKICYKNSFGFLFFFFSPEMPSASLWLMVKENLMPRKCKRWTQRKMGATRNSPQGPQQHLVC